MILTNNLNVMCVEFSSDSICYAVFIIFIKGKMNIVSIPLLRHREGMSDVANSVTILVSQYTSI